MNSSELVAAVLVIGGVIYLVIFLWITVVRVREEAPQMWPPDSEEKSHH